jgi:hypothetical protein
MTGPTEHDLEASVIGDYDHASEVALQAAATALGPLLGSTHGVLALGGQCRTVAQVVIETSEQFLAWLRRSRSITLTLVSIEDLDTGEITPVNRGDFPMAVELTTSQRARYTIEARDARGFLNKEALDLQVTGDGVTAEIVETPDPDQPNELLVTAASPSVGNVVTLDVPDDDTVAAASDSFNVRAGDVATLQLGAPVIEEIPATSTEPVPTPEPLV